jgi:hypothetical protein
MLNVIVGLISICYGIQNFFRFWKQQEKSDAIVLLMLYGIITCYCFPIISRYLPTVESLYTIIYKPVSNWALGLLNIK